MPTIPDLQATIDSLRQSMSDRESWLVPKSELKHLGFDEDMQAKVQEMGESNIQTVSDTMELYLDLLNEISYSQCHLGKLAVPQKKLAEFLIEDFQEKLSYLKDHQWFTMTIAPDTEERMKKWHSRFNAKRRKQARLLNAYHRHLPTVSAQFQRRIADLERQIAEYDRQADESKRQTALIQQETALLEQKAAQLEQEIAEKQEEIEKMEVAQGSNHHSV